MLSLSPVRTLVGDALSIVSDNAADLEGVTPDAAADLRRVAEILETVDDLLASGEGAAAC